MPAIDGEPYYPGFPDDNPPAPSDKAARYCRSGIYGSLLSGAFAGYVYGAEGLWGGNVEPESKYTITDALGYQSGGQVRYVLRFIESCGGRHAELVPEHELLLPSRCGEVEGYDGWSYCAYLPGKRLVLLYFEAGTPETLIRSILPKTEYEFTWFDPRTGEWGEAMRLTTSQTGRTPLPACPTSEDWAARLEVI